MSAYHEALGQCAVRYKAMVVSIGDIPLSNFVDEFANGCASHLPLPKLCRWLGYIQGVLIDRQVTTVTAERDWTRPLFRPLDFGDDRSANLSPDIDAMVQRFLTWKLPADFNPDAGISFTRDYNQGRSKHEPVGTNLFTFEQAKAMVLHMLAGEQS